MTESRQACSFKLLFARMRNSLMSNDTDTTEVKTITNV